MNQFENPYLSETKSDTGIKVSAVVSVEDHNLVRSVHLRQGTVRTTIAILWRKLAEALRERDITEYDPTKYEQFVANLRFADALPGRSTALLDGTPPVSDDTGRVAPACPSAPGNARELRSAEGTARKRGGNTNKQGPKS